MGGFTCTIFAYPFDTIKVLQQASSRGKQSSARIFLDTCKKSGMRTLYTGVTLPLIGSVSENALVFLGYGAFMKYLNVNDNSNVYNQNQLWKTMIAGSFTGFISSFILTPFELLKCQIQLKQTDKKNSLILNKVQATYRKDGIKGFWKGYTGCLFREIPGNLAWFVTYDFVRHQFKALYGYEYLRDLPLWMTAISGSCAGVAYWILPFPADTLKSQIQTNPSFEKLNIFEAYSKQVRLAGFRSLYKGLGITCIRAVPSHALIFVSYEYTYNLLEKL